MTNDHKRQLKVFLCHASGDKPYVRNLYKRLVAEGIDAWLDQEKLLPGQDWRSEIPQAVRVSDVVIICLSKKSITKEGYVQKEIRFALDIAEEKPEGTIFLIPARLEDCPVPERLNRWQWVDLFDDNGFIKLLRSLKLRADAVGVSVDPLPYVDSDKERQQRLEQLYTEGLAAFYTEDWDKAFHRFQTILSEKPNHQNAGEKLVEAERQKNLAKLYQLATKAVQSENWEDAIKALEELSQISVDYKDAVQLLTNARKQKQLKELYSEAQALHTAQKWKAVVKVFEQISRIDANYPDLDGLLRSAQKEVENLELLAELNNQYSRALREMETGNWHEARRLLEWVHKSQVGYRETEKLLRKIEKEIAREEEERKKKAQINTLYEQAHGLLRSKKWRNTLEKLEEIRRLDDQFSDPDHISEKAYKELEREEKEAERQNQLAALYAEAVRLLEDKKYSEALEKWQEVKKIDPKYPDRQRIQRTARKRLAETMKTVNIASNTFENRKKTIFAVALVGIIGVIVLMASTLPNLPFFSEKADKPPTLQPINTNTPEQQTTISEFPIQLRILTSSDWVTVKWLSGGKLKDVDILSSSSQAEQASFDGTNFLLAQSTERANDNETVEMVIDAIFINDALEKEIVFQVESGCLGKTTIELSNIMAEPVPVKTFSGITPCVDSNTNFEIPVELFTEKVDIVESSENTTPLPTPFTSYSWNFDSSKEGWGSVNNNQISNLTVIDGYLTFSITGEDPYLFSPSDLQISAETTPIVTIRMRVQGGIEGGIFFLSEEIGDYKDRTVLNFPLEEDGEFHTYDVDMSAIYLWKGVITQIRLDPIQWGATIIPQKVEIDYISIHAR